MTAMRHICIHIQFRSTQSTASMSSSHLFDLWFAAWVQRSVWCSNDAAVRLECLPRDRVRRLKPFLNILRLQRFIRLGLEHEVLHHLPFSGFLTDKARYRPEIRREVVSFTEVTDYWLCKPPSWAAIDALKDRID